MKVGDLVVYQAEAGCICPQMLPQFIKMHKAGFCNCKQPGTFMPLKKTTTHEKSNFVSRPYCGRLYGTG